MEKIMKEKVAESKKKSILLFLIGVVLAAGLAAVLLLSSRHNKDVVALIDDYELTEEHLVLYETDLRARVTSYFYKKYQQDPNEDGFWDMNFDGEIPSEVLKSQAMDALISDTVERIEAKKHGINTAVTLKDIQKAWNKENEARKTSGNLSYGPEQYGIMEYISKTQMDTEAALKEKLLETELKPTKDQLKELYENADQSYFNKGSKARVGIYMYYGMKTGEYPEELSEVWNFVTDEIEKKTIPSEIILAANEKFAVQIEYGEAEYDTSNLPRDNEQIAWLVEATQDMEMGQYSPVLDYGPSQGVLKVLEKEDYGKAGFEESETVLTNLWINERYPQYINQRAERYGF